MKFNSFVFLIVTLLLGCYFSSNAQPKCITWSPSVPITDLPNEQSPNAKALYTSTGSLINFEIRYYDVDKVTSSCSGSSKDKFISDSKGEIEFIINDASALSFDEPNSNITYKKVRPQYFTKIIDKGTGKPISIYRSPNIKVYTNAGLTLYSAIPALVKVRISDLQTTVNANHGGSRHDPPVTLIWKIGYRPDCPVYLGRVTTPMNPNLIPDSQLTLPPARGLPFSYEARMMVGRPSSFVGGVIREDFHTSSSGGLFNMSDINIAWKTQKENELGIMIFDPDQVVKIIFADAIGTTATFVCDGKGQFTDSHTGPGVSSKDLFAAFTPTAIQNDKVGFQFTQDYRCNNSEIGFTHIIKRWMYNAVKGVNEWKIQKIHFL
ncbi:MAG: hypothetical protein AAF990_22240 [Bacteroidota bacterium]